MAAAVWILPLTLSCCLLLTSADTSADCTHFAAVGKSYNVPLNADLKPNHRIIWKSKTATLYDSRKRKNTYSVTNEKSLILPKVTRAEAGSYTWELMVDGVTEKTDTVVLCVLDVVSKPIVTFTCDNKQTIVQFNCSGPKPQGVTYHWFEGGRVIPEENTQKLDRTSEQLGSNSFHCNVSNPVSSESSDPVGQDCLKSSSTQASSGCTHFAAKDKSYNVPLKAALKPDHRIIWKSNSVVLYDSNKTKNAYSVTKQKSLILPKVTRAKAGSYTWKLQLDRVTEKTDTVVLCVQDVVSKPKVTFTCDEKQAKVQFNCSGPQPQGVTYHWFEGGSIIPKENKQKLLRTSEQLGSNSFHCNVSNPVSYESSDPVGQDCLKTPSTASPDSPVSDNKEDDKLFGLDFWLMVGILAGGGGLVLVIIVATICCCINNRRNRQL